MINFRLPTSHFRVRALCVLCALCVSFLPSCAQGPIHPSSAAAVVGADFQRAAAEALTAYAEYKSGNADYTWALHKMFAAYQLYAHSSGDVRGLIKAWTGDAGDSDKLADRIARIFGSSKAPPEAKMAVLSQTAQTVAKKTGG